MAPEPFDCAQDIPFDAAQDIPFDTAQDIPFDTAQDIPFDAVQDIPFDAAQEILVEGNIRLTPNKLRLTKTILTEQQVKNELNCVCTARRANIATPEKFLQDSRLDSAENPDHYAMSPEIQ